MTALDEQVGGSHYKDMKIQPIEFILANNIPFAEGCVIKYVCRHPAKGGIQDLEKAKQCIDFMIEHYYPEKRHRAKECCAQYHSFIVAHPFSEYSEESQKKLVKTYHEQCICKCHNKTKYPEEGCENCIYYGSHPFSFCKCECHAEEEHQSEAKEKDKNLNIKDCEESLLSFLPCIKCFYTRHTDGTSKILNNTCECECHGDSKS